MVCEFAGYRSPAASFTVENIGILKDIDGTFVFSSPLSLDSNDATVTLTVRNRVSEMIRFAERGQMHGTHVTGSVTKTTSPGWSSSFFINEADLIRATGSARHSSGEDRFRWDLIRLVPTVTVATGGTYQMRLPLKSVLKGGGVKNIPAGDYDISFSTELQLLIGEREGQWKDFEPLRLRITSTAKATKR